MLGTRTRPLWGRAGRAPDRVPVLGEPRLGAIVGAHRIEGVSVGGQQLRRIAVDRRMLVGIGRVGESDEQLALRPGGLDLPELPGPHQRRPVARVRLVADLDELLIDAAGQIGKPAVDHGHMARPRSQIGDRELPPRLERGANVLEERLHRPLVAAIGRILDDARDAVVPKDRWIYVVEQDAVPRIGAHVSHHVRDPRALIRARADVRGPRPRVAVEAERLSAPVLEQPVLGPRSGVGDAAGIATVRANRGRRGGCVLVHQHHNRWVDTRQPP